MTLYNKISAIFISAIIIIIAVILFSYEITTISVYYSAEKHKSKLINSKVEILINSSGIKKIKANDEYDLFFGQGYTHAQDRLWQMDLFRRQAEGKLSEIFGKESLPADIFMKAIGFEQIAKKLLDSVSEKSLFILRAYADGVNFYMQKNPNKFSFEFSAIDYLPEKWEPYHSLLIARLLAFEMSFSFWNDITFGEIAEMYDREIAMDLIPDYPTNTPKLFESKANYDYTSNGNSQLDSLYLAYSSIMSNVNNIIGNYGGAKGSNSWSVQKNLSDNSNGAILANDPHLRIALPSYWYQNHLNTPQINILGYSFPGIPLVVVGRNQSIAWGITNLVADISDFYFEKIDTTGNFYYKDENTPVPFEFIIDTIKVKNDNDYVYYQRKTHRSSVISDSHIFKDNELLIQYDSSDNIDFFDDYALTFNWTARFQSDELDALYQINLANNYEEFLRGSKLWGTPPLVFNYADKNGNIGLSPTGLIPKRNKNCNPNLPNPGWLEEYDWNGYYDGKSFEDMYNPEQAYVFSANNPPDNNSHFFITNYWEPASRAIRINEMILESEEYSIRDARYMQNDILSPYARAVIYYITPVFLENESLFNDVETKAMMSLLNWDYLMSASSYEAAIYNAFITELVRNTFYDELGERLFNQYCFISSIPTRKILYDLQNNNNFWFDDKNTEEIEDYSNTIIKSFKQAIGSLANHFLSVDISDWKYGELHKLNLKHLFSRDNFLRPVVTIDNLNVGGNNTTINNTEYRYSNPYEMIVGASMRFIADMDKDYVLMSIPGGNSGDPMDPQYANQVRLWLNGGYITVPFSDEKDYEIITTITPN